MFNHEVYFDHVRQSLFKGEMTTQQVNGQEAILTAWEQAPLSDDLRHLAYMLATTYHETGQKMWPIEEYGKGAGHEYGVKDPQTGQTYYGRGYVQLTWRDNYRRATEELGLTDDDDLEWHAGRALDPAIAADVMFRGMWEGWFRSPHKLDKYFNDIVDDSYGAREIINGDKHIVPDWSGGVSIGKLIAGYHHDFLVALDKAEAAPQPQRQPESPVPAEQVVTITISVRVPQGTKVVVDAEPISESA